MAQTRRQLLTCGPNGARSATASTSIAPHAVPSSQAPPRRREVVVVPPNVADIEQFLSSAIRYTAPTWHENFVASVISPLKPPREGVLHVQTETDGTQYMLTEADCCTAAAMNETFSLAKNIHAGTRAGCHRVNKWFSFERLQQYANGTRPPLTPFH